MSSKRIGKAVAKEIESLETDTLDEVEDNDIITPPSPEQLRKVEEIRKKLKPSVFSPNYSK